MKRVYVILILLIAMAMTTDGRCLGAENAAANQSQGKTEEGVGQQGNADEQVQLRVYRGALFDGPKDESRVDAATVLLGRQSEQAKSILIEALESHDANPAACKAVLVSLRASLEKEKGLQKYEYLINPVFEVFDAADEQAGRLAASVVVSYASAETSGRLCSVARDESNQKSRLRAVYALGQLTEQRDVLLCLMELLGDAESAVASAAGEALPYWIKADGDISQIREQLKSKNPDEIIRERITRLEEEMKEAKTQARRWKGLYIQRLEREYDHSDDSAKGQLIYDELGGDFAEIKLWAMSKLEQRSATVVLPEKIGERLVKLVSDENTSVRLKAAQVLAKMGDRNPGPGLLKQLMVEKDEGVRLAILEALGEACYFAFSPGSPVKLDPAVRLATLDEAAGYLMSGEDVKAAAGAAVIRKVLEPNGLDDDAKDKYLGLLAERFAQEKDNVRLKSVLVDVMASLAEQPSTRAKAAKLFKKAFLEGLGVQADASIRISSMEGLIALDEAMALAEFRGRQMTRDPEVNVRLNVIRLAGEVGKEADLEWLMGRLKADDVEADAAWKSMSSILLRQKSDKLVEWAAKLEAAGASEEQVNYLLEMAAKKAKGENDSAVRERALNMLLSRKLGKNLANGDFTAVAELITERLAVEDVTDEGPVPASIGVYLSGGAGEETKQELVAALGKIKMEEARPVWRSKIEQWKTQFVSDQTVAKQGLKGESAAEIQETVKPEGEDEGSSSPERTQPSDDA